VNVNVLDLNFKQCDVVCVWMDLDVDVNVSYESTLTM
jgi:hypothetical protein